jgi:hypothetical protein
METALTSPLRVIRDAEAERREPAWSVASSSLPIFRLARTGKTTPAGTAQAAGMVLLIGDPEQPPPRIRRAPTFATAGFRGSLAEIQPVGGAMMRSSEVGYPVIDQDLGPIRPASPAWLDFTTSRLRNILRLPAGWDTYSARPPEKEAAERAIDFLFRHHRFAGATPSIVPLTDGGVQLEWHRDGIDVEVVFASEPDGLYFHEEATGQEWEGPADVGFRLFNLRERLSTPLQIGG